jgi:hypothetical protein
VRGVCGKQQVKCGECPNQALIPLGEDIIRSHLTGKAPDGSLDFVAGVYPMLPDETFWFLAADFDKKSWMQDVAAFRDTARAKGIPIAVERSRSGNGAHAWIHQTRRQGALVAVAFSNDRSDRMQRYRSPDCTRRPARSYSPTTHKYANPQDLSI